MNEGKFDGKGFSREPLTPEETASLRHMLREMSENWLKITPQMFQAMSEATTVFNAIGIIGKAIKIGGPVLLFAAGIGLWLRSQGAI